MVLTTGHFLQNFPVYSAQLAGLLVVVYTLTIGVLWWVGIAPTSFHFGMRATAFIFFVSVKALILANIHRGDEDIIWELSPLMDTLATQHPFMYHFGPDMLAFTGVVVITAFYLNREKE